MATIRIPRPSSSGRCQYCGCDTYPPGSDAALREPERMRTIDHYMPRCMGVGDKAQGHKNTVVACRACNHIKAGWPAEIFEWFIRQPQMKGTMKQRAAEFHRFCLTLSLAGFRSACALALSARPKPAPIRGPRGRFTKRDLRRAA